MKKLYLKVTKDKYELPLAVGESMSELARICGVKASTVTRSVRGMRSGKYKNSQYREVIIDD